MAVLLETSKGDLVIDLYVDDCPVACKNFLKLCKIKYYNNCLFHNVQRNFIAQTGDPTGTGKGGTSIYGLIYGDQAKFFEDEIHAKYKHKKKGTVAMASVGENTNASQFYITLAGGLDSLDEKHTIFGEIAEGDEVLEKLNDAYVDDKGRPYQNIRIRHTIVLDDPFDDPPQLEEHIPDASPEPQFEQGDRLEDDWAPEEDTRAPEEIEQEAKRQEAFNRAVVLEMVGDLPEAEVKPPSNMLFICKLNPVTTEEDLEIIFSRFGNVTSCDIIKDYKTGDSLCYGFIGFDNDDSCEEAYFKMNNVLIDDRRIKVDFSQSVHHIWKQFRKFGRKGDAAMAKDADAHERKDRNALGGKLELKQKPSYGVPGRGRGHQLLLGDDDDYPQPQPQRNGADGRNPRSRQQPFDSARHDSDKRKSDRGERDDTERATHSRREYSESRRSDDREIRRHNRDEEGYDRKHRHREKQRNDESQPRSPKRHKSVDTPGDYDKRDAIHHPERRRHRDEDDYNTRDNHDRRRKVERESDRDEQYRGINKSERKGAERDRHFEREHRESSRGQKPAEGHASGRDPGGGSYRREETWSGLRSDDHVRDSKEQAEKHRSRSKHKNRGKERYDD